MSSYIGSDGIRRCHNGHEWNSENIRNVPSGTYCLACRKESLERVKVRDIQRRKTRAHHALESVWKACAELTQENRS